MHKSLVKRVIVAALAAPAVFAIPAHAATPTLSNLKCAISLSTSYTYNGPTNTTTFTVTDGAGSCAGDLHGTREVNVLGGTGTARGFGPGTGCPTFATRNFIMTLHMTLTSTSTHFTRTITTILVAPPGLDTLPGAQPVQTVNPATHGTAVALFSYRLAHDCRTGNDSSKLDGEIPV